MRAKAFLVTYYSLSGTHIPYKLLVLVLVSVPFDSFGLLLANTYCLKLFLVPDHLRSVLSRCGQRSAGSPQTGPR